jgi:hypothetical protein
MMRRTTIATTRDQRKSQTRKRKAEMVTRKSTMKKKMTMRRR